MAAAVEPASAPSPRHSSGSAISAAPRTGSSRAASAARRLR